MHGSSLTRCLRRGLPGPMVAALLACSAAPPLQRAPLSAPLAQMGPGAAQPAPAFTVAIAPITSAVLAATDSAAPLAESSAVAARFPEPAVTYRTPAFETDHAGFTSNTELRALVHGLVRDAQGTAGTTTVRLVQVGSSQEGVPLEALHFSREPVALAGVGATARALRPTVLLVGQQHGDEPAGSEALLAIAQELAQGSGALGALLERINVVILARANPDGAQAGKRSTASGIDVNRDHLLLRTPEAQAQAQLVREFRPLVVVDAHEYTALDSAFEKFGAVPRFDALVQYAMVANLPEFVTRAAEEWFRQPLLQSLKAQGLSSEWYHTTSPDPADRKFSMGGVQPDTGRNVNGLRNAVSFLIETRGGAALGRAHLARRVHTQVSAIASVLKSAAARADDLQKLRRFVDADVAAQACRGQMLVEAAETPSEYRLVMLDPQSGADKPINVAWDSALELTPLLRRTRPCGYWLGADQADAALRLRGLGVQVQRLDEGGELRGETYRETARASVAGSDARGNVADGGSVLSLRVELVPALVDVRAGSYYVGLDQPLANLAIAALEPDTLNSFASHGIVASVDAQARVLVRPALKMTPMQ